MKAKNAKIKINSTDSQLFETTFFNFAIKKKPAAIIPLSFFVTQLLHCRHKTKNKNLQYF